VFDRHLANSITIVTQSTAT